MPKTVPVTTEVDPTTTAVTGDPAARPPLEQPSSAQVSSLVLEALFAAMDAMSDEARRRGLTDEILQAELEADNAERRDPPTQR